MNCFLVDMLDEKKDVCHVFGFRYFPFYAVRHVLTKELLPTGRVVNRCKKYFVGSYFPVASDNKY